MNKTNIEYLDFTWNPVTGCTPVTAGCDHCWAKLMHERFSKRPFSEVTLHPERLEEPLHKRKPARIGVCFSGDLFHEKVDDGFIRLVISVMIACPRHTFLILTKRPKRMREWFSLYDQRDCYVEARFLNESRPANHGSILTATLICMDGMPDKPSQLFKKWPLPNVWLGASISTQEDADRNIPYLFKTPAAVRYVSYEPALGPWDASRWLGLITHKWGREDKYNPDIDWVICGGESGPGARPMPPDWARSVRDQCQAAGVPFWFKQWGEYCWPAQMPEKTFRFVDAQYLAGMPEKPYRVGNKDAGCLLDGREWNELPNQVESTSQSVFTRMQSPLS